MPLLDRLVGPLPAACKPGFTESLPAATVTGANLDSVTTSPLSASNLPATATLSDVTSSAVYDSSSNLAAVAPIGAILANGHLGEYSAPLGESKQSLEKMLLPSKCP